MKFESKNPENVMVACRAHRFFVLNISIVWSGTEKQRSTSFCRKTTNTWCTLGFGKVFIQAHTSECLGRYPFPMHHKELASAYEVSAKESALLKC